MGELPKAVKTPTVLKWLLRIEPHPRVRSLMLGLVALYILFIALALTFLTYREYRAGVAEINFSAKTVAKQSTDEIYKFIQSTKYILSQLATNSTIQNLSIANCASFLSEIGKLQPVYANLLVLNKSGRVVCSAREIPQGAQKGPDPKYYFNDVAETNYFVIGKPAKGFLTGRWVSTFAYPIRDGYGAFNGLIGIAVDLVKFQPFSLNEQMLPGAYSGIINRDGIILTASENALNFAGKIAQKEIFEKLLDGNDTTIEIRDEQGHKRIVSLAPVEDSDWVFFVSLDQATILDPLLHRTLRRLAFVIAMLGLLSFITLKIVRFLIGPVENISNTLERITKTGVDERVLPVGPAEVRQIAANLNDMLAAKRQVEQQVVQSEARFRGAFLASPDAISITRQDDGRFLEINDGFIPQFGWTREEIIGRTAIELNLWRWPHEREKLTESIKSFGECRNLEAEFLTKDGRVWTGVVSAHQMMLDGVPCILSINRDITESKRSQEVIDNLSFYDGLTGLPNRRLFVDRLQQVIALSNRNKTYSALIYVDIDHFKIINDAMGHHQGDLLLKEVAQRLQNCLRPGDTVAHLGADEFVIMMAEIDTDPTLATRKALDQYEKIRKELDQPFHLSNSDHRRTASVGIDIFGSIEEDSHEPLRRAELAMYHAKMDGRDIARVFEPGMLSAISAKASLEDDLHTALARRELTLCYQAQVCDGQRIEGVEALIRWDSPQRGRVSPGEFIPVAEESGLIVPIGKWILETACAQIASWGENERLNSLTIAVNISARQFNQANFVAEVRAILAQTGANPKRLKLELTESLLVSNVGNIVSKMNELRAMGVNFSLDDFGTGYSSLSYLKQLPFDQLKIDQSFVRDILFDPNDAAIAKTIVGLAASMNLNVIAEGVETESQRKVLSSFGCKCYQGYLYGAPMPANEFEDFVRRFTV